MMKALIRQKLRKNMFAALALFAGAACVCFLMMTIRADVFAGTKGTFSRGEEPDELLVVYEQGSSDSPANSEARTESILDGEVALGAVEHVANSLADSGACVLVTLDNKREKAKAVKALENDPDVAYVQPNYKYRMMSDGETVTDEYRDLQYALGPWDETFQSSCGANVAGAWKLMGGIRDLSMGKPSATIAVLDSGCQVTHEDLKDLVDTEHAYNAVTKEQGIQYIEDQSGHGTHVAGIAAGTNDNGKGIAGASGNYANVLPINVFVGKWADTADMVTAFTYLEELMDSGELTGLHVINMSLGGYGDPDESDAALESCITRMREKDVLTVCAGGNGDEEYGLAYKDKKMYPGDFEGCMCVTSLDSDGTNSIFSDYNMDKDISAPGSAIISTMIDGAGSLGDKNDGKYGYLSGTSMASPLVAGIAALLFADQPGLTADQVYQAIKETALPVNNAVNSHVGETGSAGAIDAQAAMQYARERFDTARDNIQNAVIELSDDSFTYTGEARVPEVSVEYNGTKLIEGTDYILNYRNTIESGTATVTVTGVKSYIGSVTKEYTIEKADISSAIVSLDPETFDHDGEYHFPKLNVEMNGVTLKWGTDFTVQGLTNGIEKGVHRLSLTGKGNYTGVKVVTYRIGESEDSGDDQQGGTGDDDSGSKGAGGNSGKENGGAGKNSGSGNAETEGSGSGSSQVSIANITVNTKVLTSKTLSAAIKKAGGDPAGIRQIVIGKKVRKIGKKAFKKLGNIRTLVIKSKKLKKKTVKGALSGSKVKTIKVKVGSKKQNRKYVKRYKAYFARRNSGRKVRVK